jgi:dTDP-glucose 4,6-dehydratase
MDARSIVVTGGCGFIGSNFIHHLVRHRPDWHIVNLDALTYAGNLGNVRGIEGHKTYRFVKGNIADVRQVDALFDQLAPGPDYVVNFAAESHVDRSILGPRAFVETNINGTFNLLEAVRRRGQGRYLQVSTDEVYGSLGDEGAFSETTPIDPSSPYSASKAAADLLVNSYHHTFKVDTVITRCSNNYGPYQFPEKLIPLMIINACQGKNLPVYGTGQNVRDWIHVSDHCSGILTALEQGRSGSVYCFGGQAERPNLAITEFIADTVAGTRDIITFVKDRPGHDWRYAMDITKVQRELSWSPAMGFEEGLRQTIAWYLDNEDWWRPILSGEYLAYYDQWYGRLDPSKQDEASHQTAGGSR